MLWQYIKAILPVDQAIFLWRTRLAAVTVLCPTKAVSLFGTLCCWKVSWVVFIKTQRSFLFSSQTVLYEWISFGVSWWVDTFEEKKAWAQKTAWYMNKFRFLKHHGRNLIGHRLSCKNSCHRSLDTRRQCDLPSKSMYHCRLSQTLTRKIWCLMFGETIYKVPKKIFA